MNEISCNICMDLIPLVRDGIASPDSEEAVLKHIAHCESCRALYGGEPIPVPDSRQGLKKLRNRLRLFGTMIMMFGVVLGLSLSGNGDLFYNVLLMPAIGAVGYGLFRWKSAIEIPVLLFITHLAMNGLGMVWQHEHLNLVSLIYWSAIYAGFALVGVVIAGLLHFALRKEHNHEEKES